MDALAEGPVNRPRQGFGNRYLFYSAPMPHPEYDFEPPPPRATPLGDARGLAEGIASTLRIARALAGAGRRIDLEGLDRPIGLLCAKSLDLPPEQGRQMRVVLIALLREVDALSETLRAEPENAG
jgi:hypothetical protein